MSTESQHDMESPEIAERRSGLLIGLGVLGLLLLLAGLLAVAGPARSALRKGDAPDDLEDLAAEALD